jgi:hypothetical protein
MESKKRNFRHGDWNSAAVTQKVENLSVIVLALCIDDEEEVMLKYCK